MHCIIERMEYLFPPLSYLTHHSALSGLLNLSQTLLVSLVRDLTLLPLEHCVGFPRRGRDDAAK